MWGAARRIVAGLLVCVWSPLAGAQEAPAGIDIHGFVSQGAFVSTDNNYIGRSSRGSVELLEVGINASKQLTESLRAGIQLFMRDFGDFDSPPRIDWAFLDYRWRPWLGLRAGVIKMPFGLYNESVDVDAARASILLPQSIYPFRNRDVLLAHRGFSLYGTAPVCPAGDLEYTLWFGTLDIPANALILQGATLDEIDVKYVTGAQLFWLPPVDGLRLGGTVLRGAIDFDLTLSPALVGQLIAAGLVPPDFDGDVIVSQNPITMLVGSVEYIHNDWLFAAEYARALKHQESTLPPAVFPPLDEDRELFYGMINWRATQRTELGVYYSVIHADVEDRDGSDTSKFPEPGYAFQRDLAATLRFDVNEYWLWKLEGHFIDGFADLKPSRNPDPERYWGLFLVRTTVTF
jgi:hypothetical protein